MNEHTPRPPLPLFGAVFLAALIGLIGLLFIVIAIAAALLGRYALAVS